MLLYHPFFDPQHCVFRMLRLLAGTGAVEIETERLRIWDFYLLFPTKLADATLPQGTTSIKKIVKNMANRYEVIPDARRAFIRLEPIQLAALAHLSSVGLVEAQPLTEGKVRKSSIPIPETLAALIAERNLAEDDLIAFLTGPFLQVPLYGSRSLRMRTDLFDHRYDIS